MRAFVALEMTDRMRWEIAGLARRLQSCVEGRFVQPENYHLTLAFLGDADEREVGLAMDALDAACDGAPAPLLAYDGLGKFGNARDATLWLGLAPADEIIGIAETVREELAARGVAFDSKPFKPHVTIARRVSIPKAELPPLPFPEPDYATAVTLFKSKLDAEGATYTPIHSVALTC